MRSADLAAEDPGVYRQLQVTRNYSSVTGACLLTRRDVFDEVGGFDEERLPVTFNDVDLCLKMRRAGYLIVYTPFAKLYHHESATRRRSVEALRDRRHARTLAGFAGARSLLQPEPFPRARGLLVRQARQIVTRTNPIVALARSFAAEAQAALATRDYRSRHFPASVGGSGPGSGQARLGRSESRPRCARRGFRAWKFSRARFIRSVIAARLASLRGAMKACSRQIGFWPAQWAAARMFAQTAKGFHIHPPSIPDGRRTGGLVPPALR